MSDLKRISILVFVLLNVSASIAYRHFNEIIDELDSDYERHEQPVSSNRFLDVSKNLSKEFSVHQDRDEQRVECNHHGQSSENSRIGSRREGEKITNGWL